MNAVKKFFQPSKRLFITIGLLTLAIAIALTMYFYTVVFAASSEISILDGNSAVLVNTSQTTVQAILDDAGIRLNPLDTIRPALDAKVPENGQIVITRVVYEKVYEETPIPYATNEVQSAALVWGERQVSTAGINGAETAIYTVKKVNGIETERVEVSREITREAVDEVVTVGTKVTAAALEAAGAKYITCTATAYDGSYATLGYYNPKTALGKTPTVGTVAVDPRVIPLGKKLYIETVDGSYVYGESFAGDTGGAIKGNRVDLFMASRAEALAFGRRQVKVYILD